MTRHSATQTQQTPTTSLLSRGGILQRKCETCGQDAIAGGECIGCQKKRMPLQRRSANQGEPSEVPPIVHEVLRSSGHPLDPDTCAFMEPRFGHDFSRVRVHTDAKAAESARAVNSLAYTVGQDVVFGTGQYAPRTVKGQGLLAHELTHTIQQGINSSQLDEISLSQNSKYEREAEAVAQTIGIDNSVLPLHLSQISVTMQRYEAGEHAQFGGEAGKQEKVTINGVTITYGELIAMGDFFEDPAQIPMVSTEMLQDLVYLIRNDVPGGTVTTEQWQEATNGIYLGLAENNAAHFAPSSPKLVTASGITPLENHKIWWEKYHKQAVDKANEGKRDEALTINAFGDHFLTDAFSAGHLINKPDVMQKFRGELSKSPQAFFDNVAKVVWADSATANFVSQYKTVEFKGIIFRPEINSANRFASLLSGINDQEPDALSSVIAKVVHDKLNTMPGGVEVENAKGDKWMLSGDATLNLKTLEIARKAVAQSQKNILDSLLSSQDINALYKEVWDFVPTPSAAGTTVIQNEINTGTDPTQKTTVDKVAEMLISNIRPLIDELVARNILQKV